jgi:hypothetical protein
MKKFIFFIAIICSLTSLGSCSKYLDVDQYFYDLLSVDSAFSKRVYVEEWLSNVYDYLRQDNLSEAGLTLMWASDDLVHPNGKALQNCNYSATNFPIFSDLLRRDYECIRKASTFIDNVSRCSELTKEDISDMQAQARFLRAFAYWSLIRTFGPCPLIPEHGLDVSLSYEELSLPRAKFDDVVNFIDNDLTLAARILPRSRTINNFGRPSRGAALALRARVLLYAASPLCNGNKDFYNVKNNDGTQLYNQEYDESKWARAAAAAEDVINLGQYSIYTIAPKDGVANYERPPYNEVYSNQDFPDGWRNVDPYTSYKNMFDGTIRGSQNPELIFTRTQTQNNTGVEALFTIKCMPVTAHGDNKIGVTQKMIDTYYMNNGQTIEEAETTGYYVKDGFTVTANDTTMMNGAPFMGTDVSLMYARREPRFYACVAFNGAKWECESSSLASERNFQCWYYRDEANGKQGFTLNCPLTGIGFKKYYNKEDSYSSGGYRTNKTEPTMRYAEILFIDAEALNELKNNGKTYKMKTFNDQDVEIKYNIDQIKADIKPIRMRAGLPDFTDEVYNDQNNFRTALKRERHIELFAENCFRYFDLRRWKDAEEEENQPLTGCNINITKDNLSRQAFYIPTVVTDIPKIFLKKMYLWPYPQEELKRNINLTQNPEW